MCLWGRGGRGIRAAGDHAGGNGVRIPICWRVWVNVNHVRDVALWLPVIVIGAGHYSSSVIVFGGVVAVAGFLAREGEVDP